MARELGLRFHTNVQRIKKPFRVAIRYGNAQSSPNIISDTACNSVEGIIKCSNKHRLADYLEGSEIITPRYYPYRAGYIPEELGDIFLSRQGTHRAGKDIHIVKRGERIPPSTEYLVPFYANTLREYRVHVAFGHVIKVFRKYPSDECNNDVIRSSLYGWEYKASYLNEVLCGDALVVTALKVADILGLSFCGIDMAWSSQKEGLGQWIVWEVNSAPSLNTPSLKLYSKLLRENLAGEAR